MSVISGPEDDYYPSGDEVCILCAEDFTDGEPVLLWMGVSSRVYCHGGCAGSFVLRLARDAWQVERDAGDGAFQLTPHAARSARGGRAKLWRPVSTKP